MLWSCNYYSMNYYYNLLQLLIYTIIILFSSFTLYISLFQNLQNVIINWFQFYNSLSSKLYVHQNISFKVLLHYVLLMVLLLRLNLKH